MLQGHPVLVVNGQGVFSTEDRGVADAQAGQGQGPPSREGPRLGRGTRRRGRISPELRAWGRAPNRDGAEAGASQS